MVAAAAITATAAIMNTTSAIIGVFFDWNVFDYDFGDGLHHIHHLKIKNKRFLIFTGSGTSEDFPKGNIHWYILP
jgi:hypothetical protein